MKIRTLLYSLWLLLTGACMVMGVSHAQDGDMVTEEAEDAQPRKKGKKGARKSKAPKDEAGREGKLEEENTQSAVAAALGKFKVFNAKPNLKADYFIYLYSASWCGFCQASMPVAAEQYKKMKASRKVELIVVGGDKTEKAAIKYLKSKRLRAPGIMFSALQATKFQGLPGCGMPGFPAVSVVTKDGEVLKSAVGASQVQDILANWKEYTIGK